MPYVITPRCAGVCAAACYETCPTEAIGGPVDPEVLLAGGPAAEAARSAGLQLYINPEECIDCGACAAVCPERAIFVDDEVPPEHAGSEAENAAFYGL